MGRSLEDWAADLLVQLVGKGGMHGPGSTWHVQYRYGLFGKSDVTLTSFLPERLEEVLAEQAEPNYRHGGEKKVGRAAVAYEEFIADRDTVCIKAVEHTEDGPGVLVTIVQPIRKGWFGRSRPLGAPYRAR